MSVEAEALIEIEQRRQWRDFIGRDVVTQCPRFREIDVVARELCIHDIGIGTQKEDPPIETDPGHWTLHRLHLCRLLILLVL